MADELNLASEIDLKDYILIREYFTEIREVHWFLNLEECSCSVYFFLFNSLEFTVLCVLEGRVV